MPIHQNILELIGNTPMIKVNKFDTGCCELFLKLENMNPGGSIKDRIGLMMIEAAEREGALKPGDTLVEGTAGNTGIGLALVAQQKGYPLILVVPDKMSREKIFNLQAMGAKVILTRSDVAKGHPEYYQDLAARIARETPHAYFINQFGNPNNPKAHAEITAPEIFSQMDENMDAIVFGVGSSGTMTGFSQYFAKAAPHVELVIADPVGSILTQYINEGTLSTKSGSWLVEGIGEDFLPSIADFSRVKKAYAISDQESFLTGRELLNQEGILGGSSSGTIMAAALNYCREQTTPKRVVAIICDTGNKYLSKMYNNYWMQDKGYIAREKHNDLRDFIARPHTTHDAITITPQNTLTAALQRMKMYDISQLPVLDNQYLVGLLDMSTLLKFMLDNKNNVGDALAQEAMQSNYPRIDKNDSLENLQLLLQQHNAVLIMDKNDFLGVVTAVDILSTMLH